MKRLILSFIKSQLLLGCLSCGLSSTAQNSPFENQFSYLSVDAGKQLINQTDSYLLKNYGLKHEYDNSFAFRCNYTRYPRGNLGYSLGTQMSSYLYTIQEPQANTSPSFFLMSSDPFRFYKMVFYTGINYRFQYKRLLFVPQLQLGYCLALNSTKNVFLKEQNSNNQRRVESYFKNDAPPLYLGFRADLRFHVRQRLGVFVSVFTDRYRSKARVDHTIVDDGARSSNSDQIDFSHNSLFFTYGIFLSLNRKKDKVGIAPTE